MSDTLSIAQSDPKGRKDTYGFFFTGDSHELYNYIKDKKPELHFDYDEIMHSAHHKAFTVAKVTKLDLLKDIQESLVKAKKDGVKFDEWKKQIKPTLAKKGWLGEVTVKNPKTKEPTERPKGEKKKIYVGNRRLKTIYQTNMAVARAKGRYQEQMNSDAQFLRYSAIMDSHTRLGHAKHHGLILAKNDPFWDTHYPPNAWNCRCKVRAYTKDELKNKGLDVSKNAPESFAQEDWRYNPGKTDNIDKIWDKKIQALDTNCKEYNRVEHNAGAKKPCLKALSKKAKLEKIRAKKQALKSVAKNQLNEMVDEVIVKKNVKYPINHIVVGTLTNNLLSAIKTHLNKDLNEANIILHKNNLHHARPSRKDKYNHSFRTEEMKQIVDVIDDENKAFIDTTHNNIIYAFDDKKDKTKINLIPIELVKKIKKFDKECYVITLDKNDMNQFKKDLEKGRYKKIK